MARVPITDEIRKELIAHKKRTGVGPVELLKNNKKPSGSSVKGWLRGTIKTVPKSELYYVLLLRAFLPEGPYIPLTQEIRDMLMFLNYGLLCRIDKI